MSLWQYVGPVGRLIHSLGEAWIGDHVDLEDQEHERLTKMGYVFDAPSESQATENRAGQLATSGGVMSQQTGAAAEPEPEPAPEPPHVVIQGETRHRRESAPVAEESSNA